MSTHECPNEGDSRYCYRDQMARLNNFHRDERVAQMHRSHIIPARFALRSQAKNGAIALVVCGDQVSRVREGFGRPDAKE